MTAQQIDGYRYFFPAGWLLGIWGAFIWLLFPRGIGGYPGMIHPEIMMGGFLLCFVCGFLMTAAPRFTASFGPSRWEQALAQVLIVLLFASLIPASKAYFYSAVLLLFLFLAQFLIRRFLARKANPPDAFIFVGFGIISGLVGDAVLLCGEFLPVPAQVYTLGRLLLLQAYIFSLVLGVGSRLIPALLGWAPLPTEGGLPAKLKVFVVLAIAFFATYFMEVFYIPQLANLARAVVFSVIGFNFWKLHKLPKRKDRQAFWLWVSGWFFVIGQWGIGLVPSFRIHILHVLLIAGLALMTLMIATRVSLSHGKHDMDLEKNSKALLFGALLLIFAAFTRLSAGFAPHIYQSHLVYASYTWILGLLVWGGVFLPRILRVKNP